MQASVVGITTRWAVSVAARLDTVVASSSAAEEEEEAADGRWQRLCCGSNLRTESQGTTEQPCVSLQADAPSATLHAIQTPTVTSPALSDLWFG